MNSGLQCLASIGLLTSHFKSQASAYCDKPLVKAFGDILTKLISPNTLTPHVPTEFSSKLKGAFQVFDNKRQHDAQEFISLTLDSVHEQTKGENGWSIVSDCFAGSFEKTFVCSEGHTWKVEDLFYDLSLPIPERRERGELEFSNRSKLSTDDLKAIWRIKKGFFRILKGLLGPSYGAVVSLQDCLSVYARDTKAEVRCEHCAAKANVEVTISMQVKKFPKVLMVVIKRFSYSIRPSKIDSLVFMPMELNFSGEAYDLVSFLSHSGKISSGHYRAYAKRGDRWVCFSDSSCVEVPLAAIQHIKAYVAFYQRRSLSD
jgi:ubiquitin C-terminal hydrolase